MTHEELYAIINDGGSGAYRLTMRDGSTQNRRLFISTTDTVSEFKKGSKSRGHNLNAVVRLDEIMDAEKAKTRKDPDYTVFMRNLEKVRKLLFQSGLWPNILHDVETLLAMPNDERIKYFGLTDWHWDSKEFVDRWNAFQEMNAKYGMGLSMDEAYALSTPAGIKTVNYKRYYEGCYPEKDIVRRYLQEAREGKTTPYNYAKDVTYHRSISWQKGYDNSVSVSRFEDGTVKAWYSEEYRGCGNGYYYLLLDETYAMFCEKD